MCAIVDDVVKLVTEGQSVYVPRGAVHRMENLPASNNVDRDTNWDISGEDGLTQIRGYFC